MGSVTSRLFTAAGAGLLLGACSQGPGNDARSAGGTLHITVDTPREFDATFVQSTGEWVRADRVMGLQSTRMLVETSGGRAYINDGIGLADTRYPSGRSEVDQGTADEALLQDMLSALLRLGVHPTPDEVEIGTPRYAAAYMVVEALGIKSVRRAYGDTHDEVLEEAPTVFPYAGWSHEDFVPEEVKRAEVVEAPQNGTGICSGAPVSPCCGDLVCGGCDPNDQPGGCAPSCAAGDHCNKYHAGSGCGNIECGSPVSGTVCGTAGDNFCPHTCGNRGGANGGLAQYQNNVCDVPRMQSETSYCYYHTPSEGHNYDCQPWNCGVLFEGQTLYAGDALYSCDGRFRLTMQTDGNAVLYEGAAALWASHTNGKGGHRITMQSDGNLVVYNPSNAALWASGTSGKNGSWARVQEDGNLVIYRPINVINGKPAAQLITVWASNTCCH